MFDLLNQDTGKTEKAKRSIAGIMATNAIQRSKRKGIACESYSILKAEIERQLTAQNNRCPIFGFEYKQSTGSKGGGDFSASLDKIIPEKGYVLGNLQVISFKANRIKNDATPEELMLVAQHSMRQIAN